MNMKPSSVGNLSFSIFSIHCHSFFSVDRDLSLVETFTKDFRHKTRLQVGLVEEAEQDHRGAPKISRHELLPMGSRRFSGRLVPVLSLAFAMCTHLRLGQDCKLSAMSPQLLKRVVEACSSEPEDDIDAIGTMPDNDILDVKSESGGTAAYRPCLQLGACSSRVEDLEEQLLMLDWRGLPTAGTPIGAGKTTSAACSLGRGCTNLIEKSVNQSHTDARGASCTRGSRQDLPPLSASACSSFAKLDRYSEACLPRAGQRMSSNSLQQLMLSECKCGQNLTCSLCPHRHTPALPDRFP